MMSLLYLKCKGKYDEEKTNRSIRYTRNVSTHCLSK